MLKINKLYKVILLVFAPFYFTNAKAQQHIENLKPEKFYETIYTLQNAILIDVQPKEDFEKKHIENAINLPNAKQLNAYTDTLDLNTPILLYCFAGIRSKQAVEILKKKKFSIIYTLHSGLKLWTEKGLPIYDKTPTKKH